MIPPRSERLRAWYRRSEPYLASVLGGIAGGGAYAAHLMFELVSGGGTSRTEPVLPRESPRASGPIVDDEAFIPATTRTGTTWVEQGCSRWTSLGDCFMTRKVPVHQYLPVQAQYVCVLRDVAGSTAKVEPAEWEYTSCAVGDAWNECRNS